MDLALVVVSFSEPSQTQVSKLIAAASSGSAKEAGCLARSLGFRVWGLGFRV